jgi:N-acetylglutamate synthase-like GNAT family acetyltransferase
VDDSLFEVRRGEIVISTDRGRIDPDAALLLLQKTHWARDITRETLIRAMANSVCFGVHRRGQLIGLARVITDLATFAYWTDVVIAPAYQGQGLGRWLSECMLRHPQMQNLRRVALLTRDAAQLYSQLGFSEGAGSLIYMERSGVAPPI